MKKVGIITLSGNENYGNRLQNYALQKALIDLGCNPETIWVNNYPITFTYFIKKTIRTFINLNHIKLKINIKKFTNCYIKMSKYKINQNRDLNFLNDKYDYFVVGSDQVWNYTSGIMRDYYFLSFSDYKKNIAYAPSLSVDCIEKSWVPVYKKGLSNIKNISVREQQGQKLIKKITGKDVPVVLDPTMLLTKDEWKSLEKKPNIADGKYILTYFLGGKTQQIDEEIKYLSKKHNLKTIDLMDFKQTKNLVGVNEFLYLFDNAEIIFTDSFHACVFSIIFNKPFFVFDRVYSGKSMNSRLDTLLKTFKQEKRKVKTLKENKSLFNCDYEETNKILELERKKSEDFLRNSLI